MFRKKNKKRGFTLIELIIVIAIIAILAAIAVPAFGQIREKANVSTDVSNARTIYSVVAAEIADEKVILPTGEDGYTYSLSSIGTNGNEDIATDLLSTISDPKAYQSHEFAVWLNSDGDIQIYVVPKSFSANQGVPKSGYRVYPNVTEDSKYDK